VPDYFPVVGVIGAGSSVRMLIAPAVALGLDLLLFAENPYDSAAQVAHHVLGDLRDLDTVKSFAKSCTVVTLGQLTPLTVIRAIEAEGIAVRPGSVTLALIDKMNENLNPDPRAVRIAVMVARSPHGQASAWTPTFIVRHEGVCVSTQTPVPNISEKLAIEAQRLALTTAKDGGLVGVMAVEIVVRGRELVVNELSAGPHEWGHWTIEGSRTSQFEQHLRAILDLPLGDPSMTSPYAVTGGIFGGAKGDMYRPYLHLMARSPALKIHQYRQEVLMGNLIGHVTAVGDDLLDLQESVLHAVNYMSGVIDG